MYYDREVANTAREFPHFEIVYKRHSPLMRTLGWLLRAATFGRANTFMTEFVTTIGTTVYVPNGWAGYSQATRSVLLRHERVHMRQQAAMGRVRFFLTYLLWPVPFVYAKGRRDLERPAYLESLRADHFFFGFDYVDRPEYRAAILQDFNGPDYMWMWRRPQDNQRWFDEALINLHATVQRQKPVQ